ncbi:MAG: alpha/beta fold hydrolase [Myxococcaceae bacterium]
MSIFDTPEFNQRLFFPRPDTSPPPAGAEDLFIDVAPGVRVHARRHPAPKATRAELLLFHGNGEVVADYDDVVPSFARLGVQVTVFDFRGYGASTGTPTLRTALLDGVACVNAVPRVTGRPRVLFGRSLGAAVAAELAGQQPPLIDALVLESGGSDLERLLSRRGLREVRLTDAERATFDPRPKLARCRVPALVLHGDDDTLIEPVEARGSLAALGSPRKQLVLVPGRGHNDVSFAPEYWAALDEFLARLGEE